jgi:septal ring factor EnvC (AmiA/AmiB activator)
MLYSPFQISRAHKHGDTRLTQQTQQTQPIRGPYHARMRKPHTAVIASLLALPALLGMPGCIIWDAYDQVELANQQLGDINTNLNEIEANLATVDAKLATIDENLGSVDGRLDTLQVTLDSVSESLESLRKTINNIDSTIPFLDFSGDDEETQDELEAGGDASSPAADSQQVEQE